MHESVNELRSDNRCFYTKRTYHHWRELSWRRFWLPIVAPLLDAYFSRFFIHIITSMFYHLLSVTCCGMSSRLIIKRRYTVILKEHCINVVLFKKIYSKTLVYRTSVF